MKGLVLGTQDSCAIGLERKEERGREERRRLGEFERVKEEKRRLDDFEK